MRIGIFDSGIGGEAVARELAKAFPDAMIMVVDDRLHLPYGLRPQDEIVQLTDNAIQPLLDVSCDVIVLACNTATAAAIETLRERYPDTPFVGLEPMIKPAAQATKTGTVAICATPATLTSQRYRRLKRQFASNITVLEPDCSDWAFMIENNRSNEIELKHSIEQSLNAGADVIVLGCTHYHWIKDDIQALCAGRATVIEPSAAIAHRITMLLKLKDSSVITVPQQ